MESVSKAFKSGIERRFFRVTSREGRDQKDSQQSECAHQHGVLLAQQTAQRPGLRLFRQVQNPLGRPCGWEGAVDSSLTLHRAAGDSLALVTALEEEK